MVFISDSLSAAGAGSGAGAAAGGGGRGSPGLAVRFRGGRFVLLPGRAASQARPARSESQ